MSTCTALPRGVAVRVHRACLVVLAGRHHVRLHHRGDERHRRLRLRPVPELHPRRPLRAILRAVVAQVEFESKV